MESAKMGKCGCGPFKIHKKKVFALLRVITKVFLLCDTNASKMGRNFVSSAERKSCKCQLKCQLNRVSPVPQKKKNWKAMTQHQSLLRELAHQIWVRVFFGLLNRLHMFSVLPRLLLQGAAPCPLFVDALPLDWNTCKWRPALCD